jgi:hypothetical protein
MRSMVEGWLPKSWELARDGEGLPQLPLHQASPGPPPHASHGEDKVHPRRNTKLPPQPMSSESATAATP